MFKTQCLGSTPSNICERAQGGVKRDAKCKASRAPAEVEYASRIYLKRDVLIFCGARALLETCRFKLPALLRKLKTHRCKDSAPKQKFETSRFKPSVPYLLSLLMPTGLPSPAPGRGRDPRAAIPGAGSGAGGEKSESLGPDSPPKPQSQSPEVAARGPPAATGAMGTPGHLL